MLLSLGEEACCLFQWFPWTQVQLYVPLKPSKVQQWFEVSTKIKLATDQIFVMFFVTTSLSTRSRPEPGSWWVTAGLKILTSLQFPKYERTGSGSHWQSTGSSGCAGTSSLDSHSANLERVPWKSLLKWLKAWVSDIKSKWLS